MIHKLKTWPDFFEVMKTGIKTFEYRKNDRGFQIGDVLVLEEWDPKNKVYTGRKLLCHVTYIVTEAPGLPEGYCIMQCRWVRRGFFQ